MRFTALLMILTGLFAFSCSGHPSTNNPLTPSPAGLEANGYGTNNHILWGLFDIVVTPTGTNTADFEIVPMRGPAFNANVQRFLSPPVSPVNLLSLQLLPTSNVPNGFLDLNVGLRHPFLGLNQYRGFDVRGIFMGDATFTGLHDPGLTYSPPIPSGENPQTPYMLNADGYTRWWNWPEFTDPIKLFSFKPTVQGTNPTPSSTLNPFKYFSDTLSSDDDAALMDPATRGSFSPTSEVKFRRYTIQFEVAAGVPKFKFNYAIDASWALPDPSGAPDYPVDSFPPEAQQQEPYHISVSDGGSDMFYINGISGGNLKLRTEIFDWQAPVNVSGVQGEISSIWLEGAPLANPVNILPLATISAGSQSTSSVFEVELDASYLSLTSSGTFEILGTVESTNPNNYQPEINGGQNIIYPQNAVLSAYFITPITVGDQLPALTVIKPNGGEAWQVSTAQDILWTGASSINNITIEYSKDDFASDINIIVDGTENDGTYHWSKVPNDPSTTVKVRVRSSLYPEIFDVSNANFSIVTGIKEMIVYAADGPATGRQIYSIDPEGVGPPKQWSNTSAMFNENPKLSPDAAHIMYTSLKQDLTCDIDIIDIATGIDTPITPPDLDAIYGDFSHDGSKIVTAVGIFGYPLDIWTVDYNGSNPTQLSTGLDIWSPEYNFDDTKIYYMQFNDAQVYIFDVATAQATKYTDNGTWNDDPHGSPDGKQIAWATMYGNSCRHIFVSPLSSWNPPDYELGFDDCVRSGCFSPDGKKIAFDHGGFAAAEVGVYDIETGTWFDITANTWGDYMADWGYMIPN